ncbi:MAG: hypothetical protein COV69_01985 [Parcubacteria group bacterium CG11_big_fil_rev_8_21_14_0_20_39_14]|nr:MAG: hypothetical protein COV69_01985 [Parcubacteria group bacterium CG11_big_fil_rev_8_21_14_0_20_39_14]PIS35526.1 MAG: hypothetical protein COT36_01875 [Parcubacteria group bacterium CG08_land_8_20_14_0_20_38_56]
MVKADTLNIIKKTASELLKAMGEEGSILVEESGEPGVWVNLNLKDPQFLIGPGGIYLEAFERLLRAVSKRKIFETGKVFINVDINNYRKRRAEFLKELAREIGDQVSLSKKAVTLEPMSAFERRIVHLELASRQDVATESVGEEPERKVEISPHP